MTVLTEELLANAERIYRIALAQGERILSGYDWESGVSAVFRQERFAEEKTKWLT